MLPTFDAVRAGGPPRVVQAARRAEELGFDAAWAGDHLVCPAPGLDSVGCLSAAAAVTDRITLGFSVMLLALRPAAWAAKQLITVDALSGGRLVLGVGVGGEFPAEFAAAGVPHEQRGPRLDEALTVLPDLLTGRAVKHDGPTLKNLRIPALEPAMATPPCLYVGGRGEHALRRAARFGDAWMPMWLDPPAIAERASRMAELASERGRRCPTIALLVGVHVDPNLERARLEAASYLRGQYDMPLEVVERWTALGSIERVVSHLEAHLASGVQELVLMALARDPLSQYERLAEVCGRLRVPAPSRPG